MCSSSSRLPASGVLSSLLPSRMMRGRCRLISRPISIASWLVVSFRIVVDSCLRSGGEATRPRKPSPWSSRTRSFKASCHQFPHYWCRRDRVKCLCTRTIMPFGGHAAGIHCRPRRRDLSEQVLSPTRRRQPSVSPRCRRYRVAIGADASDNRRCRRGSGRAPKRPSSFTCPPADRCLRVDSRACPLHQLARGH